MRRLLFAKEGNAVWISHLDLMRVFQRAFRRSGMLLKHSQGFTPHAYVSIALPLSVGVSSQCELLQFELDASDSTPNEVIADKLNAALPDGIRVRAVYDSEGKLKELTCLQVCVTLEYDAGVPADCCEKLERLFAAPELVVRRRTKKGEADVDIRPMIDAVQVGQADANTVCLTARISAQNPALNPQLLVTAIETHLPDCMPEFAKICREEIFDAAGNPFR